MAPESLQCFLSLAIGFAVAGLLASGYQALTQRPLSFWLITQRATAAALAAVPLLVFAAPFLIMRSSLARGRKRGAPLIAIATALAGFWSLMSGTVVAAGWLELVRLLA
ncbi:MAG: hypothetical protein IRZ09_02350 [Variibacter sp.]|nr:hypothetical protein [Variibacter sp.]